MYFELDVLNHIIYIGMMKEFFPIKTPKYTGWLKKSTQFHAFILPKLYVVCEWST
jgi:hypothetical protein